jgi:ribonuclease R
VDASSFDHDSVVRYLRDQADRPMKARELAAAMDVPTAEYGRFREVLKGLERQGAVYRHRKGRYSVPANVNLAVGVLQITRSGDGFVVREEIDVPDVFVRARDLASAVEGDTVAVRVERARPGKNPQGRVVRVVERAWSEVVGRYHSAKGYGYILPQEPALGVEIFVPPDYHGGAADGQIVVAEILEWGDREPSPVARVTRVLGSPDAPGVDILALIIGHRLPTEFPESVEREAQRVARRGIRPEDLNGRVDFREQLVFTIDPEDARDHDDAVSVRELDGGGLEVGIHIADVSFYVKRGSELDQEALERGTSVYLVDRVIPMLPELLSGGLCSLKAGEDRLTLSLLVTIAPSGSIESEKLVRGVVRSRVGLSYERAQLLLDGVEGGAATSDSELGALRDSLTSLQRVSRGIRERRREAGTIDFDLPEAQVILDENGVPLDIRKAVRLESHRLVEDLMILANEAVARIGLAESLPFVYRVHEDPDEGKLEDLRTLAQSLGLSLPRGRLGPGELGRLVTEAAGTPHSHLISTVTLRSMKQARYSTENHGHFGLASDAYTHFTSPIRRYPDLVVHRELVRWMRGKRTQSREELRALEDVARHSSTRERRAVAAERDSVDLKRVEYMRRHLGDEFTGRIEGVRAFGFFVLLDDLHVEGLVHVSSLGDDYYAFDEERHSLVGRRGKRVFQLGDPVTVQVARVDEELRQIDFELIAAPLDRKDRGT